MQWEKEKKHPSLGRWCDAIRHWLGLDVRRSAGKRKDAGSIPRFGSPFSLKKKVIYGHRLVTLLCIINETLKWLTSLPILLRKSLVVTV